MIAAIVVAFIAGVLCHWLADDHSPPKDEPNIWEHYRRHGNDLR